jgi:site-specific DNA-methyltransferase (adenine-specific)
MATSSPIPPCIEIGSQSAGAACPSVPAHQPQTVSSKVRLIIDREFHRLLYPMPNVHRISDDNLQDRERARRDEWRAMHRARYEQIAARLKEVGAVDPFKIWVAPGGERIIIDGRHYEYSAAVRLGLPICVAPVACENREHAQSYMIAECLLDKGRPRHSDYYRIQLAAKCKYIVQFAEEARANRGRRTDLLAQAPKSAPRNTRKQIAVLAGCGETTVRKALELGSRGALYFEPQRWLDIENALIVGDMAISHASRKLKGEMDFALEEAQCAKANGKIPLSILQGELDIPEDENDTTEDADCADEDDQESDGEEPDEGEGKKAHRRKTATSAALADARERLSQFDARRAKQKENIKKRLTSFPYQNPDLDTLNWEVANKIICGNNAAVMAKMPNGIASLVFGSPPYPVPKEYEGTDYAKPLNQWLENDVAPVVSEASRVLRDGGRLALQVADCFELRTGDKAKRKRSAVYLPVLAKVISLVESLGLGFLYRETKVWLKFVRPARAPLGSLGSPSDPKSYNSHEWIIVWSLRDQRLAPPKPDSKGGMTKDFYRQRSVGAWYYAPVSANKLNHPCPFPEGVATDVIKLFSWPDDLVIDPWSGSGTTAAMAAKLGRRWIGIDIEDSYCRGANVRVHEAERERQKKLAHSLKNSELRGATEAAAPEANDDSLAA